MKCIKKYRNYVFLFCLFFFSLWFFGFYNQQYDSFWNYSFSYAITRGQIPYVDFNMVSTPFTAFFFSIFLLISNNYIFYLMGWSLVLTITFYFLFQLLGNRAWLILFLLLFPFLHTIIPTYNLFCFCLFVLLLYMEKFKKNDFMIGIVIGLSILTKHTVGFFFLLPSFIYLKHDIKKFGKRLFGCLLPCVLFLFYLLCTGSFYQFFDLCVLGLFDFSGNLRSLTIYFYLSLLLFVFVLYFAKKKDKSILSYYVLGTVAFTIPLFDSYHFSLFLVSCAIFFLLHCKDYYKLSYVSIPLCCVLCFLNFFLHDGTSSKTLEFLPNLRLYRTNSFYYQELAEINRIFQKYHKQGDSPIILSTMSSFVYTGNDLDLNYFLVFLKGNYGYNGSKKLIAEMNKEKDRVYIIQKEEFETIANRGDYLYEVSQYVIENFKFIEQDGNCLVYRGR